MKDTLKKVLIGIVVAAALALFLYLACNYEPTAGEAAGAPDGCKNTGKFNYRVAAPDVNQDTGKVTQVLQDAAGLHKPFSGSVPGYWVKGGSNPGWKPSGAQPHPRRPDCPSLCCSEVSLRNVWPISDVALPHTQFPAV